MNVQEPQFDPLGGFAELSSADTSQADNTTLRRMPQPFDNLVRGDRVGPSLPSAPFGPSPGAAGSPTGPWGSVLSQLASLLSQIISMLSGGSPGALFQHATGASTGDPHLSFDGTNNRQSTSRRFDSMSSHRDLLDSDSFDGGFRVSTRATQPDSRGVTYNRSASVTSGSTRVSLDRTGEVAIDDNGRSVSIADGQTLTFGSEAVTKNANGSLMVADRNGDAQISATLRATGTGVDVSASAQNADLAGDLVTGTS